MGSQKIAVVGTRANGASIGADLTRAGLDVTFIEQWPAHVEAMRKVGIRIEMPDETLVTPVRAFHLCEVATLREAFDIVLIVVKAYDTEWACELIKPLVKPDGLVVGVQNGMTMEDVASIVGPERTLGAVIEVTSNMFQPGVVVRQTPPSGSWFGIGAFDASTSQSESGADRLGAGRRHDFAYSGHSYRVRHRKSQDRRRQKFRRVHDQFHPFRGPNIVGDLHRPGMTKALPHFVFAPACRVPIFGKSRVEVNDPEAYAKSLMDAVLSHWAVPDTRVAVLQDWMKGRRGEVDDINGEVAREQRRLGGRAPVNEKLIEIAGRIESGALTADPSNAGLLRSLLQT
jgi:2-dehydropantoate 2-reductase